MTSRKRANLRVDDEQKMCWADVALSDSEELDQTQRMESASTSASSATSCEMEGTPMWYQPAPAPQPVFIPYGPGCSLVGVVVVVPEQPLPLYHEAYSYSSVPWHAEAQYDYAEHAEPHVTAEAHGPSHRVAETEAAPAQQRRGRGEGTTGPATAGALLPTRRTAPLPGGARNHPGRYSRLAGRRHFAAGPPTAEARQSKEPPVPEPVRIPDASEETWQLRLALRIKTIELVKRTREYASLSELRRSPGDAPHEPPTPDPADRTTSKRKFKFLVQSWRNEILKNCGDDGQLSTVSTQDLPSLAHHRGGDDTVLE